MKKVTVVVNKNWEIEGVMSALVNTGVRPAGLPFPDKLYTPKYDEKTVEPRAVFSFKEGGETTLLVTLRCIQDSMYYDVPPNPARQSGSSSEEKLRVMPDILKDDDPDLVISVSTAGYPADFSCNGSVVIGGNFFLHNGHPGNPKSDLKHDDIGKLLPSNVNNKLFGLIDNAFKNSVEPKFLKTPRNPCEHPSCMASRVFTALSVINVTEYEEYNWADNEALAHYKEAESRLPCNSSETTHGVVKLCTDKPIIFVSPITDQFGHFDFEVTPTQNFAASFNAGVVAGQLLCEINSFAKAGNSFEDGNASLNYKTDRIIVKYKAPQTPAVQGTFMLINAPTAVNGVRVKSMRIINPAPSGELMTISLADTANQGTLAVVELMETGADAVDSAIRNFEALEDVEYVERDYTIQLAEAADTPDMSGCLYGLKRIEAPKAWGITRGDKNVVVGVIDSGIDFTHAAIKDNMWINPNEGALGYENDKYGYDFVNMQGINDAHPCNDNSGHGTHVAGTIGANGVGSCSVIGVAPNVRLAALKVVDIYIQSSVSVTIEAINYAANMGMLITNNSYIEAGDSRSLREAVRNSGLFIAAAGNLQSNNDEKPAYPASYDFENVIAVAASSQDDVLADFSNYGADSVHLAAPGVEICSARSKKSAWDLPLDGYFTDSGTSMATPHVAGVAALVLSTMQESGELSAQADKKSIAKEIKARILNSVDKVPELQSKVKTGGRLNAFAAVAPKQK